MKHRIYILAASIIALVAIIIGSWLPWQVTVNTTDGYISIINGIARAADETGTAGWTVKFEPTGTHYKDGSLKIAMQLIPPEGTESYKVHYVEHFDDKGISLGWWPNPALTHFIVVEREITAEELTTWVKSNFTADLMATIESIWDSNEKDTLIKPISDYFSPLMKDIDTDITEKTAKALESYYIDQVNERLDGYEFKDDIATVGIAKEVVPQSIDIGAAATDRASSVSISGRTTWGVENPANADGSVDSVETWWADDASDANVGTVYLDGSSLWQTRDYENIGYVAAGSKQTFTGLSITTVTDDQIAISTTGGTNAIERDTSGGSGYYLAYLTQLPFSDVSNSGSGGYTISLYATGTESGGTPDISNSPSTLALGVLAPSSTYWSNGSEPSWPLTDGDAYFTVTNNGSIAVDISANVTNWTGGVGWTNVSGSPGENQIRMTLFAEGDGSGDGSVLSSTPSTVSENLSSSSNIDMEIKVETGSSFTDGVGKTMTITLIASAS